MPPLPFRIPAIQLQLNPNDPYGRYNCAAYSGGMAGDADSRGLLVFTGKQVRAHSTEPVPNQLSPGLTLQQVDASLFELSNGRINLDVHPTGSPFYTVPTSLRAGEWAELAIWRGVLVDAGHGFSSTFRQAHGILAGYDQNRKVPIIIDPLVNRVTDVTWSELETACSELMRRWGFGSGAYYSLTRDVFDVPASSLKYSAIFTKGEYWQYILDIHGNILTRVRREWEHNTSAPCTAPETVYPSDHWKGGKRKLVMVTKGAIKGAYVEPGSTNVRLEVSK